MREGWEKNSEKSEYEDEGMQTYCKPNNTMKKNEASKHPNNKQTQQDEEGEIIPLYE